MNDGILVGCDWKNPGELVQGLVNQLPKLGLYAYDVDGGGDYYNVIISKVPLNPEQVQKLYDELTS